MNISREEAQQILDALEIQRKDYSLRYEHPSIGKAITLLQSRLAEGEQELASSRIIECAKRLVEHADFKLGGILSADSKAKDIPSNAVSQVKSRHLAALRDALAAPQGVK